MNSGKHPQRPEVYTTNGRLTIERETGENRVADIAASVAFLRRLTGSDDG
jgi:hypothetical protein